MRRLNAAYYRSRLHFALRVTHEAVEKPHAETLIFDTTGLPDLGFDEPTAVDDDGEIIDKEE